MKRDNQGLQAYQVLANLVWMVFQGHLVFQVERVSQVHPVFQVVQVYLELVNLDTLDQKVTKDMVAYLGLQVQKVRKVMVDFLE